MQLDQTEVAVCKSDILARTVQSFNPTELLRDVLWKRWCHRKIGGDTKLVVAQVVGSCDDALEISFLCKAELHQCAYIFPANVDKSLRCRNLVYCHSPTINVSS